MKRQIFKSKIHRATVTGSNIDYEGSVTIDSDLMRAADILPYEAVHIWNISNGARLFTYAIQGKKDSGEICVNGAGAKLCSVGDLVIIATFSEMTSKKAREWIPTVIQVNKKNKIVPIPIGVAIDVETSVIKPGKKSPTSVMVNFDSNYLQRPLGNNTGPR